MQLDGAGNAKLCDFGLAAEADVPSAAAAAAAGNSSSTSRSLTASMRLILPKEPLQPAGSPRYMPPELAAGGSCYTSCFAASSVAKIS